jgi:hypothetical protein
MDASVRLSPSMFTRSGIVDGTPMLIVDFGIGNRVRVKQSLQMASRIRLAPTGNGTSRWCDEM